MKWSLFNWKKPVVSSGEPEDYQVVKNTVNQNTTNIRNLNNQVNITQGTVDRNEQSIININNQLNNTVSTNTAQTITGTKTFNEGITINKTPIPLLLKATNNDKNYIVYRDSNNNSNLSIGANATSSSIEVNRGNLEIQTQQTNKAISINTGRVKFNHSVVEFGTEINAGFGGGVVKFIPEDDSTKTLQFFNNNANDTRRFKLAVPEPTETNNPATKNYVDTQVNSLNSRVGQVVNDLNQNIGYNLRYQDLQLSNVQGMTWGNLNGFYFYITSLQETKFLSAVIHYKGQSNSEELARGWDFNYATTWGPKICFTLKKPTNLSLAAPAWNNTFVRIFYISALNTLDAEPFSIVEEE